MALLERVAKAIKRLWPQDDLKVPQPVAEKLQRGATRRDKDASKVRQCFKFFRGEFYWWIDAKGTLRFSDTLDIARGGQKADHRVRTARNHFRRIIRAEVSAATQRIPDYDISPTTSDSEDQSAARLAKRVARYGHYQWGVRRAFVDLVTHALVGDEGFVWPYFDTTIGRPIRETGLCEGDLRFRIYGRNECFWEPGLKFYDSPWHAIQQARPIDEVEQMEGYLFAQGSDDKPSKLIPDASTKDNPTERNANADKLVLVTDYLERPCLKYPKGRWLTIANDRIVCGITPEVPKDHPDYWREYPGWDDDTNEPCLHQLFYVADPDNDRSLGLGRDLVDPMLTYLDCVNKSLEYKNRLLHPRLLAPQGSGITPALEAPGQVVYFNPIAGFRPEWEKPPPFPRELFDIAQEAIKDMESMAAQNRPGSQVEAARAFAAIDQQNRDERVDFYSNLAEVYGRVMSHALSLVAKHYTEKRLLQVRGRAGWEPIKDFRGAQLRGQTNVRVLPGSIEPQTREAIQQKVTMYIQMFPGVISPEAAMSAIEGGLAEDLIKGYELQIAHANLLIEQIKAGPELLESIPQRYDSELSPMMMGPENPQGLVPGWMPRKQVSIPITKQVLGEWILTPDFASLPPDTQEYGQLVYDGIEWLEQMKAQKAQMAQMAEAESRGLQNAARTPVKPMPSLPKPDGPPAGEQP